MTPEGWKSYQLEDICEDISYGYTESASSDKVGPKFLRITDIQNYFTNWDTVPYCPISTNDHSKYKLEKGDIVIARTGATTGVTSVFKEENIDAVFASYLIRYRVNKRLADPFYIGYILKSALWKSHVNSVIGGSAQPNANAKQFGSFEFVLPTLSQQSRIASILSSLDDKIELNLQMNKTLEAIAQAIFKEWFVDFRFPGFEGELVNGLPKGWRQSILSEVVINIKKPVSANNRDKYAFYLPIDSIDRKSMTLINSEPVSNANSSLIEFIEDDVLFGAMRSYFHKVILAPFTGLTRTTCFVFRPIRPEYLYYVYLKCFQEESITYSNKTAKGTTMPYAVWEGGMASMPILIPPLEVCKEFNHIVESIFNRIKMTFFLNTRLMELRDSLLPKLMTGKIRV